MKKQFLLVLITFFSVIVVAQESLPNNGLKYYMTPEEAAKKHLIGKGFVETLPPTGEINSIAEFSYNDGVLVRYPFGIPIALIKEIAKDAKVLTIVANSSQQATVTAQYQSNGVNLDNCSFIIAYTDSYWTRDYGPWYITYGDKKIGIVDFPYNRPRPNDNEIAKKIAQLQGIEWFGMNVIHTGGNYMCDGYNTASSTTLVYEENHTQTHQQIDDKMRDYLGINNHMVVEDPNGTYIDHIDCWGKFLAPDKILIRQVPPSHPRYSAVEETAAYYAQQTNEYGKKYTVYRVYNPNNEPYSNSLIIKNKVFVPLKGTVNDAAAILTYKEAMPGYEVIGVVENPGTPWESTDALHCRTHELADLGQLRIVHTPLYDSIEQNNGFEINADIISYSNSNIYADSTYLIYKVNNGDFDTIVMQKVSADKYTANIPQQIEGSLICYYIESKDESGRTSRHPYIGSADPHMFIVKLSQVADITVIPDELLFDTYSHAVEGLKVNIYNYSSQEVTINDINWQGSVLGWWADSTSMVLPYVIQPGDSTAIDVFIDLNTTLNHILTDTMFITSEASTHKVVITANPELFNDISTENNNLLSVYPNPCDKYILFKYNSNNNSKVIIDVYDTKGQFVAQPVNAVCNNGFNEFYWNLDSKKGGKIDSGIYYFVLNNNSKVIRGKFIVK
ncbi:MAG: agmatine deiminase family protein [Bacteroidales bacterium]|jgi:agmatine deiminase